MKKFFMGAIALTTVLSLSLPIVEKTKADELPKAKCEMTITDKNDQAHWVTPEGVCKDIIYGYYEKNVDTFLITGLRVAVVSHSGQTFVISTPNSSKYVEADLTVYTKRTSTSKPSTGTSKPTTNVSKKAFKVNVIKNKSAVHTSNSGKSKTIKTLNTNTIVEVVQTKGSWYKIKNGSGYGWIYNKYVSKNLKPITLYKVRVTKNKSAVHTSNSGKSKTIKTVNTNTIVEVVQTKGSWYKIKNGSGYGWIYNKYVSENLKLQTLYKVRVTKNKSAVHTSNSGKSKTIKTLNTNTIVEVVQASGSWYKIKNGLGYAWIYNKYVKRA